MKKMFITEEAQKEQNDELLGKNDELSIKNNELQAEVERLKKLLAEQNKQ